MLDTLVWDIAWKIQARAPIVKASIAAGAGYVFAVLPAIGSPSLALGEPQTR